MAVRNLVGATGEYCLPSTRWGRWLAAIPDEVPSEIRPRLLGGLYGSLSIFFAGVTNSIFVATFIAIRIGEPRFFIWLFVEALICGTRLALLLYARTAHPREGNLHTDLMMLFALLWASSVGFGSFICLLSGDWVASALAMTSSAAMIGGICIRNFGTPRLSAAMMVLALGPACLALPLTGQPLLYLGLAQIPVFVFSMCRAAYALQKVVVTTMVAERQQEMLARHDALTGLLNRMGLAAELRVLAGHAADNGSVLAFMYLDLDGFKNVNDTFGHVIGDRVLCDVANRLRACVAGDARLARIGGDEFVFVGYFQCREDAGRKTDELRASLKRGFCVGGRTIDPVGLSIGLTFAPPGQEPDLKHLLQVADMALYTAKRRGKGVTAFT